MVRLEICLYRLGGKMEDWKEKDTVPQYSQSFGASKFWGCGHY